MNFNLSAHMRQWWGIKDRITVSMREERTLNFLNQQKHKIIRRANRQWKSLRVQTEHQKNGNTHAKRQTNTTTHAKSRTLHGAQLLSLSYDVDSTTYMPILSTILNTSAQFTFFYLSNACVSLAATFILLFLDLLVSFPQQKAPSLALSIQCDALSPDGIALQNSFSFNIYWSFSSKDLFTKIHTIQ